VRRSTRARRARLTVTERGEVVVVLPQRASAREAERLVFEHGAWVDRHVVRFREEHARLAARPALGAGRTLTLEGSPLAVWLSDVEPATGGEAVEVQEGRLVVRPWRTGRGLAGTLEAWLRERARTRLAERVQAREPDVGVRAGRVSIRDQRSRWASASPSGNLSFSWRLILAPPFVLDAVVVHELAHLRVRGHSPAFWALVVATAPRTADARRWLREHARELRGALE
jgi:predicted metal-dependent hydrolase